MKSIKLKYRKYFIPRTIKIQVPEYFSELTDVQFIQFVKLFSNEITIADQIQFVQHFLNIEDEIFVKFDTEQIVKLLSLQNSLFEKIETNSFFIKNIAPEKSYLVSPKEKLKDLTFSEFIFADTFYMYYIKSENIEYLDKFINCLYKEYFINRIAHTDKLDEYFDKYSTALSSMDIDIKKAISFNYQLVRNWLEKQYIHIFEENDSTESQPTSKNQQSSWHKILISLAVDVTKIEEIGRQNVHTTLTWLDEKIKENPKN